MLRVLRDAVSWGDLRHTMYGLLPALLITFVSFFQIFESQVFTIALPEMTRDLHTSLGALAGLLAVISIVALFGGMGVAYYFDAHRRAPWVGLGAIVSGLSSVAMGRASTQGGLAGPLVTDVASGQMSGVPQMSLLADYYPPEMRGRVYSVWGTLQLVGTLLSSTLIGLLIAEVGWRNTTICVGLPTVAIGVVALVALREPVRGYFERTAMGMGEATARIEQERPSFGEAWRTMWAVRTLRRLFVADIFIQAGGTAYLGFFVFYLADTYGLDPFQRGLAFVPGTIAALVGGFVGGGMVDAISRRNPSRVLVVFGAMGLTMALGVVIVALQLPLVIALAGTMVAGFGQALARGSGVAAMYSQVTPPNVRTMGLGLRGLAIAPSLVIFLPIEVAVIANAGYQAAFLLGVPLLVIGALIQMSSASLFETDRRNALLAATAGEEQRRARAEGRARLLVCREVDVAYEGNQVLFGVDFEVAEGEIVALLGTNGAGKSTLLRAISGGQEASAGAIVFDGRDITHMPPHETAKRGVILMPGGRGVFGGLSVRENLRLSTWMCRDAGEADQSLRRVYEMFPLLAERGDAPAGSLSGGEQQMLSLAQAFVARPRLLMIDELSLGLSPAVVGQLLDVVKEIHARGTSIIVVEQSVNLALTIAERAVFMEKGEVKFNGSTADLLRWPELRAVFVKGTAAIGGGTAASSRQARSEVAAAAPVLEVERVTKSYGGVRAVSEVTLSLRRGEVVGIIGPNGSGKTTLFDLISGYQPVDGGSIGFDGVDVTDLPPHRRSSLGLVRRFQDARLFPSLTVHETLLVALDRRLEVRNTALTAAGIPQVRRAERRARLRADNLVELLELSAYRDKLVKELSTGVRRIVDLACVLATSPTVLLLDEPSAGIAQAEAEGLAPLLRRVRHETGCSLLVIEHDMPLISALADELVAMDRGRVLLHGPADAVLSDPRVVEAYLGGSDAAIRRSGSLR